MMIGKIILEQLGGNKFIAMTGAKNLVAGGAYLSFHIGRNSAGINGVRIELTYQDLYKVEFLRLSKKECKVVEKYEGVYSDDLQNLFTRVTGMATRL